MKALWQKLYTAADLLLLMLGMFSSLKKGVSMKKNIGKMTLLLVVLLVVGLLTSIDLWAAARSCGPWQEVSSTKICMTNVPYGDFAGTLYKETEYVRICTIRGRQVREYKIERIVIGGCEQNGGGSDGGGGSGGGEGGGDSFHSYIP